MKIVQVTEDKIGTMSECAEKMLHYGGKLMSCIEELESGGQYGERSYSRYGNRYGNREWEEEDEPSRYGNRGRMRDRYGRYM